VAHGEGLPDPSEDDLLVSDQARQAHGMDPDALDVSPAYAFDGLALGSLPLLTPGLGHALRGGQGGPGRSVELPLMVELDDLGGGEHAGSHGREALEEDCPDGEVGSHDD